MATVTARAVLWNTTAGVKTTASITPANGELLVAIVGVAGTDTAPTMSDSKGGAWTLVDVFRSYGAAVTGGLRMYCRNTACDGTAMTVTMTPAGDSGGGLAVLSCTDPGAFGASAVRSTGGQADQAAGTPAPVLSNTPVSVDPVVAAVMTNTNGSANGTIRTGYTEDYDLGFNTPPSGLEVQHRNSGETSATLTQGGATPSGFAAIAIEIAVKQSVAGGVASEADTVPAGKVLQVYTSSPAAEADSAPAGKVLQRYTAAPAAEADSVPAGAVGQPQVISGGVASEADSAPAGTVAQAQVVAGGVASEAESAPAGKVQQIYTAGPAAEADSALPGTVIQPQAVLGGVASEGDSAPAGTVAQVYTAAPASAAESAPAGKVLQVYTAAATVEADSAPQGEVQQGDTTVVNGGVAREGERVPAGFVLEVYAGGVAAEVETALAGYLTQIYTSGPAGEVDSVPAGTVDVAEPLVVGVGTGGYVMTGRNSGDAGRGRRTGRAGT